MRVTKNQNLNTHTQVQQDNLVVKVQNVNTYANRKLTLTQAAGKPHKNTSGPTHVDTTDE